MLKTAHVKIARKHEMLATNLRGRLSKKSIRDALHECPGIEFVETETGAQMSMADAKGMGFEALSVAIGNGEEPLLLKL